MLGSGTPANPSNVMKENEIYHGDVLEILKGFPDQSVNCVITSPPYWGLRDYGTSIWNGGDSECDHSRKTSTKTASSTLQSASTNANHEREGWKGGICGHCGATRIDQQIGLEKTPEEFLQKMVDVFREVNRILKDDGTLWLNLGDSYAGSGRGLDADGALGTRKVNSDSFSKKRMEAGAIGNAWVKPPIGFKPKDLIGIPWRVALALQADGWYLRQDIIWSKPNPMPESVLDRCTKAHEYIFLMSKRGRYYYDADAIREPLQPASILRLSEPNLLNQASSDRVPGKTNGPMKAVARKGWHDHVDDLQVGNRVGEKTNHPNGANKRSVWSISTKPFKEAHFATFPEDLIAPMIKAGCPGGGYRVGSFHGRGDHRRCRKETRPEVCRHRIEPGIYCDRTKSNQ